MIITSRCRPFFMRCCQSHFLHTTGPTTSTASRQMGKAMKKLMGTQKKKYYQYSTPTIISPERMSKGSFEGGKSGNARRATVLNKLFMRHITDLMATGEYSTEVHGQGIEISSVKISTNYDFLNIYWFSSKADSESVEKLLNKNAGYLEHELSQLRLMGNVPTIKFVKDKNYGSVAELEKRLAIADFGDDYFPADPASKLRAEFELFAPLEEHLKKQIEKLDIETNNEEPELPLPPMTHSIFGVHQADIMERVKRSLKTSEASHRHTNVESTNKDWAKFKITQKINSNPVTFDNAKPEHELFKQFLEKRLRLKSKAKRDRGHICDPDLEYIREESHAIELANDAEKGEEDYVIDDDEEKHKKDFH